MGDYEHAEYTENEELVAVGVFTFRAWPTALARLFASVFSGYSVVFIFRSKGGRPAFRGDWGGGI
jgi:hypothetical protein